MTYPELKEIAEDLHPAILLEKYLRHPFRSIMKNTLFFLMVIFFIFVLLESASVPLRFISQSLATLLSENVFVIRDLFFVFMVLWIFIYMWEWMYISYAFKKSGMNVEVAKLVLEDNQEDITKLFFSSNIGKYVLLRLGISEKDMREFLKERKYRLNESEYIILENDNDPYISLSEYGSTILHYDRELRNFFLKHGITIGIFQDTLDWTSADQNRRLKKERWWGSDNLGRVKSIGRKWTLSEIKTLEQFGHLIYNMDVYKNLKGRWQAYHHEVNVLKKAIVEERKNNILLLSSDNRINLEIVGSLAKEIENGTIDPELESKRVYILDWRKMLTENNESASLKNRLEEVVNESAKAEEVILVINDFAKFVEKLNDLGIDAHEAFRKVLDSKSTQFIVLAEADAYRQSIEPDFQLTKVFHRIDVEDLNRQNILKILKDQSFLIEEKEKISFTYPGLMIIGEMVLRKHKKALPQHVVKLLKQVTGEIILANKNYANRQNVVEALNSIDLGTTA